MSKLLSLALGLTALGGGAVSAATVNPLIALDQFNAIVFTNASTPSDIEGAAIIGGNFSGATIFNNPVTGTPAGYASLTVFGNTTGNSININNGGTAYVGGTKGAPINFNGGGKYVTTAPPEGISAFQSAFTTFSTSLDGLKATSTLPVTTNNEIIQATPAKDGVAVFDITASQLASIPSFSFNLNGAKSVIINVSGASVDFAANYQGALSDANDIIWNFYKATSVTLCTQIPGTILAPYANVSNANQIDGVLVAKSWTGSGELHDYAYTGSNPLPVSGAPEPSTWALMMVGIGGLGLSLRRGRKTKGGRVNDAVAA